MKKYQMQESLLAKESSLKKLTMLISMEGVCLQLVASINAFGNNLYATNMGASDTQIGLIQLFSYVISMVLLLPTGIFSDQMKNAKRLPFALLLITGVMYFFFGSVPVMGTNRMVFFFVFLSFTTGLVGAYNGIWQAYFADVVTQEHRNSVLSTRLKFTYVFAIAVPLIMGFFMGQFADQEGKLWVLRLFFYLAGLIRFVQAYLIYVTPCEDRTQEQRSQNKFSFALLKNAFAFTVTDKKFRSYFVCMMFFYMSWHMDWSMWYIGQVQYVGMTEQQLSYCTAAISLMMFLSVGFISKLNQKKNVTYTFILGAAGLCGSSIAMLVGSHLPALIAPWVFIALCLVANSTQVSVNLSTVQMLLDVVPENNRALIISIEKLFVTISNGVMPFLGVKLYTLLGADFAGFTAFYSISLVLRIVATLLFVIRYKKLEKEALLPE